MCGEVSGHQLDEYLQATRVSIARDRVTLDVDLTPGVTIAPAIVQTLDANADNVIAPSEAGAYGRAVLSDVVVTFDGHPVVHGADAIEVPTIDEMRHGMGTIHLRAVGSIEARAGRHRLDVVNGHRRDTSVYLVNALVLTMAASISCRSRAMRIRGNSISRQPCGRAGRCCVGLRGREVGGVDVGGWGMEKRKRKNEKGKTKSDKRRTTNEKGKIQFA